MARAHAGEPVRKAEVAALERPREVAARERAVLDRLRDALARRNVDARRFAHEQDPRLADGFVRLEAPLGELFDAVARDVEAFVGETPREPCAEVVPGLARRALAPFRRTNGAVANDAIDTSAHQLAAVDERREVPGISVEIAGREVEVDGVPWQIAGDHLGVELDGLRAQAAARKPRATPDRPRHPIGADDRTRLEHRVG